LAVGDVGGDWEDGYQHGLGMEQEVVMNCKPKLVQGRRRWRRKRRWRKKRRWGARGAYWVA
jgi:hypothetical protein